MFGTILGIISIIKFSEINVLEFNVWNILVNRKNTSEITFLELEMPCVNSKLVMCTSNTSSQKTSGPRNKFIINTFLNILTNRLNISGSNYNSTIKDEIDVSHRKKCLDKSRNSNQSETDTLCTNSTEVVSDLSRIHEKIKKYSPIQVSVVNLPVWLTLTPNPNCTIGNCHFFNGDVSETTDVVIVMGVGLQGRQKPPVRWPGQLYAMFSAESPMNYEGSCLLDGELLNDKTKFKDH